MGNDYKIFLDEEQKAAVEYNGSKPLIVDAGPGSGKTRVIIERVVYLINELKQDPSSMLVITFTNKAADELKARLKKHSMLTIDQINQMRISTIHSFCRYVISNFEEYPYNLLKRNGERGLFLQKHKEELGFIKDSFLRNKEVNHAYNKYSQYSTFKVDTEGLISYIEENELVSDEFKSFIERYYENHELWQYPSKKELDTLGFKDDLYNSRYLKIAESYPKYLELLEREHVSDQDYLLIKSKEILRNENNLKNLKFTNILIDEFQDTDPNQMAIFEELLKISNTFMVVGDVDQSIYGFRGAYPKFFVKWAQDDRFERIVLKNNYRSTKEIVGFNEELISQQRENKKELVSKNDFKMPVYNLFNRDIYEQAENIVKIVKHMKDTGKIEKYSDIAILFRARNKKIFTILDLFDEEGIPYYLKGINDLFNQDEVKAVIALYWYLLPHDNLYLRPYEDEWLSLNAFTNVYYKSSKIFKLSKETREILRQLELNYHIKVKDKEKKVYFKHTNKDSKIKRYKGVFNRSDEILAEIFEDLPRPDLSKCSRSDLIELGITNEFDLDFFEKLNEIKRIVEDEDLEFYEKPTTLQLFYKLINISGYHDEILTNNDHESYKASLNLSLISEIISDYESIIGKWNINGLFNYLSGILTKYSCPINDIEANADKVHIMTIHKSKGLEYPVVILGSLEEGSFPKKFDEKRETGRYVYGKANYYTPNEYLEFKPDTIQEEASNYDKEEKRVIYVGTTRAEELLILSNLEKKDKPMPLIIANITRTYPKIRELNLNNLDVLKKVKPRDIKEDDLIKLNFEKINSDYLFCPKKYNLLNNLSYRNTQNNINFINDLLHIILSSIHKRSLKETINDEIIKETIDTVLNSYSISSENILNEVLGKLDNIIWYWQEFGKNYNILDYNLKLLKDYENFEVFGKIDLLVSENDNQASIIKFITSTENIFNMEEYLSNCNFYGVLMKSHGNYKNLSIKNIIVHSIADKKQFIIDYDDTSIKKIENIFENIINNQFKESDNCDNCEFCNVICRNNNEIIFKNKFLEISNELISEFESNDNCNVNKQNNYRLSKHNVYNLYNYIPEEKRKYYDFEDVQISDEILKYKNGSLTLIKKFSSDLIDFIQYISNDVLDSQIKKICLVPIPSSTKNRNIFSSMKKTIRLIEKVDSHELIKFGDGCERKIINLNELLIRTTDVNTAHKINSPRPSYEDHINSIEFNKDIIDDLEGCTFILLDDITTTGTIMDACEDILCNNGIEKQNIYKFALAETVRDGNEKT